MTRVPILFTFDQSLEMPAGVCLTSLLEHADESTFYDIFILHGPACDFSRSLLNKLPEVFGNCRITFRKVVGEFEGGYEIRGIPETAYYRLISPELIPEYDRFLYSDVIFAAGRPVFRGCRLREILSAEMGTDARQPLGLVPDGGAGFPGDALALVAV